MRPRRSGAGHGPRVLGALTLTALTALTLTGCISLPAGSAATAGASGRAAPSGPASEPTAPAPGTSSAAPTTDGFRPVDPDDYRTEQGTTTRLDFDSPSRNLHCGVVDTLDADSFYGCAIEHRTYAEPKGAGGCAAAYGHGFQAPFSGRPHALCRGDVLFLGEQHDVAILRAGESITLGAITCFSRGEAVSCRNARGDGFTLSAKRYTLSR